MHDDIKDILKTGHISTFTVVYIDLNNPYRMCTLPYEVVIGGHVYDKKDTLLSIDAPRSTTVVDREVFKIVVTDEYGDLRSAMSESLTGKRIEVSIGLINTLQRNVGVYAPGEPILDTSKMFTAYKGYINGYKVLSGNEAQGVEIQGSSPMGDLGLQKRLYTTPHAAKQFLSSDTCFDNVYDDYNLIDLQWGKR
jgi:hypothetical protein